MPSGVIGHSQNRVDGPLKVTGKAVYAAENNPPGLLHAVLVCSTISRGAITAIDTSKARGEKNVQVLTDFTGLHLPFDIRRVNFFGQPVAVVVADTLEKATHAASLVQVHYTPEDAVTDMAQESSAEPISRFPDYRRGDPDAALASAHVVVDGAFTIAREHHNPMELPAAVAQWQGDELTIWDKTQGVQGTRDNLAKALSVVPEKVRVLSPFVGGAFGSALQTWPHQVLAAFAARQLGKPVKLVLTRKQMYTGIGYRPRSCQRMRIGADAQGRISAIAHEARSETARYAQYAEELMMLPKFQYTSAAMDSQYRLTPIDTNLPTSMRGPGAVTGAFALECAMDDLAHQLGIDPIELRRRNEPAVNQTSGLPFSTRRILECYTQGAQRFGWSQRDPKPRARREGGLLIGTGMAAAGWPAIRRAASSSARMNDDGTAVVASATSDIGPGTYTSMTQVAAETLGLPISRVTFQLGDSALPQSPNQGGSLTMASVGSAVFTACTTLRDGLARMAVLDPASPLHGASPAEVSADGGRLFIASAPERGETYQQILRRKGRTSMDTLRDWQPGEVDKQVSAFSYGAVFAEVAVDELLGLVRIRRIFGCYDAGRVVNPKLAHSQAIGGMVGGIGMALLEGTHVDHRDGRIRNANLADYLVPVNADVPELDAMFLDGTDMGIDPLGVKGLGEIVVVGVPAAIANAVFNATGKRVTELPITLDKLL